MDGTPARHVSSRGVSPSNATGPVNGFAGPVAGISVTTDVATERHDELGVQCVDEQLGATDPCEAWRWKFPFLSANGLRGGRGAVDAVDPDHVETAIAFLKLFGSTKRGTIGSYTLKHDCENWGSKNGRSPYVSNGALIIAALELGLPVEEFPDQWSCPNALIGISLRDYKRWRVAT
jgi:hypothetical protein